MRLVLASRSPIRRKLLETAGLRFDVDAADVDEQALGQSTADPAARALLLAREKACATAGRHLDAVVVGADQVGVLEDGTFLEKPRDPDDHVRLLLSMAGKAHTFHPVAVVVVEGNVRAVVQEAVTVFFRPFERATAEAYVASGEGRGSCGGYESENRGAQLIARIDGSTHAVLGLPLLPLLDALRRVAGPKGRSFGLLGGP